MKEQFKPQINADGRGFCSFIEKNNLRFIRVYQRLSNSYQQGFPIKTEVSVFSATPPDVRKVFDLPSMLSPDFRATPAD